MNEERQALLVVEDDPGLQKQLKWCFDGCEVIVAEDREAATLWEAQHRRFHLALVSACGSAWLLRFWSTLADHSERYRKVRLLHRHEAQAEVRDVNSEHAAIMEAVLKRDAARACDLLDAHLSATETSVLRLLRVGATSEDTLR